MKDFLRRVDLADSLEEIIEDVTSKAKIGKVISWEPIKEGYEELNIKVKTHKGFYVIKIFSKGKKYATIRGNIEGLINFSKARIPVPKLIPIGNHFLYKTRGKKGDTYICVMEFFNGMNFQEIGPTKKDIVVITKELAKIHMLPFRIHKNYDSWGTANLLAEFEYKKKYLNKKDLSLLKPIVDDFRKIDFNGLRKSIIHGDWQRKHVLKNSEGGYCILDLGVMDFNCRVIDLAIFLALFCFDAKSEKNNNIFRMVIEQYEKTNKLSTREIKVLPFLIKATYAIYLLGSNYLIFCGDKSRQTREWLDFGRRGIKTANIGNYLVPG